MIKILLNEKGEKKMKKKILLIFLASVFVIFTLAGCEMAEIHSELTILSTDGSGTRVIRINIPRDEVMDPRKSDPESEFYGDANSFHFPQGFAPVLTWANNQVPAGVTVEFSEDAEYYIYTITITFSSIEDYNNKVEALIDPGDYLDFIHTKATLVFEPVEGGYNATFTEMTITGEYIAFNLIKKLRNEDDLFDNVANTSAENHSDVRFLAMTIGDESWSEEFKKESSDTWENARETIVDGNAYSAFVNSNEFISLTGFVASSQESATPTERPIATDPGDSSSIAIVMLLMASTITVVAKLRKSRAL